MSKKKCVVITVNLVVLADSVTDVMEAFDHIEDMNRRDKQEPTNPKWYPMVDMWMVPSDDTYTLVDVPDDYDPDTVQRRALIDAIKMINTVPGLKDAEEKYGV